VQNFVVKFVIINNSQLVVVEMLIPSSDSSL